jgi:hypothetical protein
MKPKPVLYGSGTGLAVGDLGVDAPRLAKSGAREFTDVIVLDRGRRTVTAVSSQMAIKQDEDDDCLPELCAASLVIERIIRVFSVRLREVVDMEGIGEDI